MNNPHARPLIAASLAAGLLAGCVAMGPDPMLESARQKVAQAQADNESVRYAQPDINRAQQLLDSADTASRDGYNDLARHDAYLANQIASAALQTGAEHAALDHIASGESDRQQIEMEARNREVTDARMQAQAAEQRAQSAEAAANQATTQQLQSELAGINAQLTDRGIMVNVPDDQFKGDQATLQPNATAELDQLAQFLSAHPERRVLAEGHTDGAQGDGFSLDLSRQRAMALKAALVQRGIATDRIDVAGAGQDDAVAANGNPATQTPNRWVEVIISDASGVVASR